MMYKIKLITLLCTIFSLFGCASIINGTSQDIHISTNSSAEIFVNDQFVGKGQRSITLKRDEYHKVLVKHGECQQTFHTKRAFNKTTLAGVLLDFGLITVPMDFATGAAWNITPDRFHIEPNCMKASLHQEN